MSDLKVGSYELKNLGKVNIILGKNGCGKSTLLRKLYDLRKDKGQYGEIKYIPPERGGALITDLGVEASISGDESYLNDTRSRGNQGKAFRQECIASFKNLELLFFRKMEQSEEQRKDLNYTFDKYLDKINVLLDNIEIKRDKETLKIYGKGDLTKLINSEAISSGEAELISLAIDCLVFEKQCSSDKDNYLLLDEPDVHLHPDLQARFCKFLLEIVKNEKIHIILATHSTAIVGALISFDKTHIAFMKPEEKSLEFFEVGKEYRTMLPIFGAHPLSRVYSQSPIFLVEGQDDERIWQQVIRTSGGKPEIHPCVTNGKNSMCAYEEKINKIIDSVYDNAIAYSLYDGDVDFSEMPNNKNVVRFKLQCRASENLLLSDEVLNTLEVTWDELKQKIEQWLLKESADFSPHAHYDYMQKFKDDGFKRQSHDLKEIRNDLMSIMGSSMTWELAVGKTIGKLISKNIPANSKQKDSVWSYLGEKLTEELLFKKPEAE